MQKTKQSIWTKLLKDEQGGEILEYALIAGLIVVAAIAVVTSVGNKLRARWTSLNTAM
jgi:pilus assembly protein Flp/PilA